MLLNNKTKRENFRASVLELGKAVNAGLILIRHSNALFRFKNF